MRRIPVGEFGEVMVGRSMPDPLLPDRDDRRQAVILHQPASEAVARNVSERCRVRTALIELPDGEAAKRWDVVASVHDRLSELNLGRHDTVVGVGGGACTDVAGFVAATWLRGIESVLVPTTLLGAVDASIGGKTGINHRGKNLVGAFWHPTRVVVDLEVLDALPDVLRIEGTAEIVKTGFLADPDIVAAYEKHGITAPLDLVVPAAIGFKARVVSGDPTEQGRRAILNFGHTLGHGIELVARISHGHAVAIGMVAAAAISESRFGFDAGRLETLLFDLGLPIAAAGVGRVPVLELVSRDKKRTAEGLRMVLLRAVADPIVDQVTDTEVTMGLRSVGIE